MGARVLAAGRPLIVLGFLLGLGWMAATVRQAQAFTYWPALALAGASIVGGAGLELAATVRAARRRPLEGLDKETS